MYAKFLALYLYCHSLIVYFSPLIQNIEELQSLNHLLGFITAP